MKIDFKKLRYVIIFRRPQYTQCKTSCLSVEHVVLSFCRSISPFLEMDLYSNFAWLHCGQFSHFDIADGLLLQIRRNGN